MKAGVLSTRLTAVFVISIAVLLPSGGAQAQWYSPVVVSSPPPLYPYAVQTDQPYAIEVAPGTYVINRPDSVRTESRKRVHRAYAPSPAPHAPNRERRGSNVDPALVEELRNRSAPKSATHSVINTTKVVREKPVVIETKRYVDDPPRVVERYQITEDKPARAQRKRKDDHGSVPTAVEHKHAGSLGGGDKRVIEADAEITILGPDRMSIRLFRRGGGRKANAKAE